MRSHADTACQKGAHKPIVPQTAHLLTKARNLPHSQDLVLALEEEGKLLVNMHRLAAGQAKRLQVLIESLHNANKASISTTFKCSTRSDYWSRCWSAPWPGCRRIQRSAKSWSRRLLHGRSMESSRKCQQVTALRGGLVTDIQKY